MKQQQLLLIMLSMQSNIMVSSSTLFKGLKQHRRILKGEHDPKHPLGVEPLNSVGWPSISPSYIVSRSPSQGLTEYPSPSPVPSVYDVEADFPSVADNDEHNIHFGLSSTTLPPSFKITEGGMSSHPTQDTLRLNLDEFKLDLVASLSDQADSLNNNNQVFRPAQDITLLSLLSYQLESSYNSHHLDVIVVDLEIREKIESVFDRIEGKNRLVLVSYILGGSVVVRDDITSDDDYLAASPIEIIRDEGKVELMTALMQSNDEVLQGVTDLDASSLHLDALIGTHNDNGTSYHDSIENDSVGTTHKVIFSALMALTFLSATAVGYLTRKMYKSYHTDEVQRATDECNEFESLEVSVVTGKVTPISRETCVGMEEDSESDGEGWSSASTSTSTYDEGLVGRYGVTEGSGDACPSSHNTEGKFDNSPCKKSDRRDTLDTMKTDSQVISAFGVGWESEVEFKRLKMVVNGSKDSEDIFQTRNECAMEDFTHVLEDKVTLRTDGSQNCNNSLREDITEIILNNNVATRNDYSHSTPRSGTASSTDALYAQISRLNKKNTDSENELSSEAPLTPPNSKDLLSRHASYKYIYESHADSMVMSRANISAGIFTAQTLGAINRNRLKATPPPSEGDYDEDEVKNATENTLLGWMEDRDGSETE